MGGMTSSRNEGAPLKQTDLLWEIFENKQTEIAYDMTAKEVTNGSSYKYRSGQQQNSHGSSSSSSISNAQQTDLRRAWPFPSHQIEGLVCWTRTPYAGSEVHLSEALSPKPSAVTLQNTAKWDLGYDPRSQMLTLATSNWMSIPQALRKGLRGWMQLMVSKEYAYPSPSILFAQLRSFCTSKTPKQINRIQTHSLRPVDCSCT